MKIIVGLGNPGEKYKNTRHNLGFMVVEEVARKFLPLKKTKWEEDKQANALVLRVSPDILLVRPLTFMNASGQAVIKLISNFKIQILNIWVVHDDVDLPLGKIKIRRGGGSAGHRGVESIINELGTDEFVRFRMGIGHPGRRGNSYVEKYVLQEFGKTERSEVKKMIKKTLKAIQVALEKGLEGAMNEFNS